MKKIKIIYRSLLLLIVVLSSCNKEILELEPLNAYSDAAVWRDPTLAEIVLNGIYVTMENSFNNKYCIGNFVDELHRRDGAAQLNFNNSKLTPDQIPGWVDLLHGITSFFISDDVINSSKMLISFLTMGH